MAQLEQLSATQPTIHAENRGARGRRRILLRRRTESTQARKGGAMDHDSLDTTAPHASKIATYQRCAHPVERRVEIP